MKFDVPLDTRSSDHSHVEIFKSWRSFSDVFDGAKRMRVVTYCDSPEFILDLFEDLDDLESLEVVVGDVSDYRERLIDKPDLADRLEQLRSEGKLVIYLCENKEVHSKLYLIEYDDSVLEGEDEDGDKDQMTLGGKATDESELEDTGDGTPAKVIVGSPNLSRNAWSNQTNVGVVYDTKTDSNLYGEFEELYRDHRDSYNSGGPFLEDLSEQLELSDDDREEVIKLYTEGRVGTQDELGEVHGRLADHIDAEVETVDLALDGGTDTAAEQESEEAELDSEGESSKKDPDLEDAPQDRITLSLRGYEESTVDTLSQMTDFDATVSNDTLTTTPDAFQRYAQQVFDVPTMHLNESKDELKFHYDGTVYRVTQPPSDPEQVNQALVEIEDYFATVDNYGNSNNPTAVKAHMYEALLWFFWAPFANRQAAFYREHGINLDKALPYLYVFGESNGGKGTFCRFALSLISGNRVEAPVDADEIGKRKVRNLRSAHTSFPVVVDDITKQKVNSLDTLRNYWSGWTGETAYPMFAFISNDKRPGEWFRNRAKILRFDVNFMTSHQGEAEVNRLIDTENPIFQWFGYEYLNRDLVLGTDSDALREVRAAMQDLYEHADRPLPDYFPTEPAEKAYDTGRERWRNLIDREDVEITKDSDTLQVTFPESMNFELHEYKRDPPMTIRIEKRGLDLIIKTPDEFFDWLGETSTEDSREGFLSRARNLLSQ
ncbi:tyrosyl-DNA phosphodiesterase [Natrarchaeobaculum sulfurireducens]|uniref:Tyrosyl-DNA phosphodiesterase n=1 Tax=Natrarchaeobaculum sulfurireducens TaxID=2044521 RepID=A0A346P9D5_9EURY|nr:tyrosyl-DNA phosphodiesterase [Natrarchaeobaculum sulfurireducens]AXR76130.1 tyrosyl-DNA phosphodiesterase [Natrarchaeobaculum sulfurireducens]